LGLKQRVQVEDLHAGQKLSEDVMVLDSVMLRRGTVLTEAHIARIKRLGLREVVVEQEDRYAESAAQLALEPTAAVPQPDLKAVAAEIGPTWMADESFTQLVPRPPQLSSQERLLAEHKVQLRAAAGLRPIVDPQVEDRMTKGLHAAFMESAVKGRVDLARIGDLAKQLSQELKPVTEDYISFLDIPQFGHFLAARSMLSSKVYSYVKTGNGEGRLADLLYWHLALCNAYALLPASFAQAELSGSWDDKEGLRNALVAYCEWLRSQQCIAEQVLELLQYRFERHDGSGLPYGLKGEEIPDASQNFSLAWHYSGHLFSQPKNDRQTPHRAAEGLVRQSGRAFSGKNVNRFLHKIGYYPIGSLVELSDGSLGVVVKQNKEALFKPVVRIVDSQGNIGKVVDLIGTAELFIVRQVLEH
jgi:hypothetical protein